MVFILVMRNTGLELFHIIKLTKDYSSNLGGVSKSMLKKSRLNFDKIEKCK